MVTMEDRGATFSRIFCAVIIPVVVIFIAVVIVVAIFQVVNASDEQWQRWCRKLEASLGILEATSGVDARVWAGVDGI